MILVVGSTGFLGSEICRRLTSAGRQVRGLVRTTSGSEKTERLKSWGVETVIGDLRNPDSLAAACMGVHTVISTANATVSMQPGDSIPVTDQQGQLDLVEAARAAGVKQFILVSIPLSISACPLSAAKHSVENAVMNSGMTYTILRSGFFMEVWLSSGLGFDYLNAKATIYGDGHGKNAYISLGDVAEYCVQSVDKPAARNMCFDLSAPGELGMLEVVQIFERVSGKSYELQFIPAAALAAQAAAATDPLQNSFATMMHDMAVGGMHSDIQQAQQVFGLSLKSVADYARQVVG